MNVRSESLILVAIVVVLVAAVVLQGGGQAAVNPGDSQDPVTDPGANSSGDDIILPPIGDEGNESPTSSDDDFGPDVTPPVDPGSDGAPDDGTTVPPTTTPPTTAPPTTTPDTGGESEFTNEGTAIFVVDGFTVGSATLEVADTPAEQEAGLSGRTALPDQAGMAFVFDQEYLVSMWMKDTTIPLDLIFVNAENVVVNVEQANPQPGVSDDQLARYESDAPVLYVIAVNQGYADELGIGAGTTVEMDI
ncbi:DUF192 domain-containing protein [Haloarchaeobius sp. HME9146]|uniref:DUF192 domain-containing protein n=1 Tax=Haloarchaeobius sp. HME9146 TaxID=2978732 RepID=UPI0021C03AC9|nr:DUF192 domain-containing protein [Haloarchaeobius sp. HME9146]MCT9098363.1 DUF192 domain-containing protein [Haloarchaeobius sp. HME9146]